MQHVADIMPGEGEDESRNDAALGNCRSATTLDRVLAVIDEHAPALMEKSGLPGLAIVCSQFGNRAERYYGVADIASGRPVDATTRFRLGSMSKPFLATLALKMVTDKVVFLDEPVLPMISNWKLPVDRAGGFDPMGVTLHRLLSHTSGFDVHSFPDVHPIAPMWTAPQLLDGADGPLCIVKLASEPGTKVEYSGGGMTVIQLLIENLYHKKYIDVLLENVLEPLGMKGTSAKHDDCPGFEFATGHLGSVTPHQHNPIPAIGASGLYSTPADVATIFELPLRGVHGELPGRGLMPRELAEAMYHDQRRGAAGDMWGYGLLLYRSSNGVMSYRHGGQRMAWFCHAEAHSQSGIVFVMMANADTAGDHTINPLAFEIRKVLAASETPVQAADIVEAKRPGQESNLRPQL